jgi:8-oxo-dGTP diphosphatase
VSKLESPEEVHKLIIIHGEFKLYKKPSLTVDAVIICKDSSIVLIKRKKDPYKDSWALPGGFVEYGETVESAILREVKEETGLEIDLCGIVGVYSDPERDPRGHTVTICYLALKTGGELKADTDASDVTCIPKSETTKLKLAFDHDLIIKDAFKIIE